MANVRALMQLNQSFFNALTCYKNPTKICTYYAHILF